MTSFLNPNSSIGEVDLHLFNEGRHEKLWQALGAHVKRDNNGNLIGTAFSVWAPNASAVSLIHDNNFWDKNTNPMVRIGTSGIWETFLPNVGPGLKYKYAICSSWGQWVDHADPMARQCEVPPSTASIVNESVYKWGDDKWMSARKNFESWRSPVSVYEVHLGSWKVGLSYKELAVELIEYIKSQGFTHVEFLPVTEHPYAPSWGYQVTGFFAPTSRFGTPDEFKFLVDQLHNAGIGVILDWVPAHFPKDEWALAKFDGTALYEHADPRQGEHPDWGTLVFNFGRREVRNFLVASALYWLEEFHIDGLRVDAVASMLYLDYSRKEGEWVPNSFGGRENLEAADFLKEATSTAYKSHPGIMMIAEESTAWPGVTRDTSFGGLGFGFKWNMGWMHDSLNYFKEDPLFRKYHHNKLTFGMLYHWSESFIQSFSHDEVVHGKGSLMGKMGGSDFASKAANLRCLLALQWAWPGKKSLFMGCEFGQIAEWSHSRSLDWHLLQYPLHEGLQKLVTDLNALYKKDKTVAERDFDSQGFNWIHADDGDQSVLIFERHGYDCSWVVVGNFTPVERTYRFGVPCLGKWEEAINTDSSYYAGKGSGNLGGVMAEKIPAHNRPQSIQVCLPGLSVVIFRQKTKG